MQQQPDRRKLVAVAIIASSLLVIVLVVIAILTRIGDAVISRTFASGIKYGRQMNDNKLYFFTGSAFASYDLSSHTTEGLTPFYALPTSINNITMSPKGALWHASTYTITDRLHQTLVNNDLDPFYNYWWLFDFETDKVTLIGNPEYNADIRQAVWQDEDTYAYSEKLPNEEKVQIMRGNIGSQPTQLAVLNATAKLLAATENNLLYLDDRLTRTALISRDIASGQETDLTEDYSVNDVLATGPDGSMLLLVNTSSSRQPEGVSGENEVPRGELKLYNHQSGELKKIEDRFSGNAMWRFDNDQWLAAGLNSNNEWVVIFNEGNNIKRLKTQLENNIEYWAVGRTNQGPLVTDPYGNMRYASQQQATDLPVIPDAVSALRSVTQQDRFSMAYDSVNRIFNFYIINPPNKTGLDAALEYIRGRGVDPYQINTRWYGANGPDFSQ